jgi:FtsP/CotA-like multicopper oxidase with cupredoxin domain
MNATLFAALILIVTLCSINNPITNLFAQDDDNNSGTCQNTGNYLTSFNCGVVDDQNNTRHFTLIAQENNKIPITASGKPVHDTVYFPAWTFNGTVPGPTMRMTEGDHVFVTVQNSPNSKHSHSLHMHSVHDPSMDGTSGPSGNIAPGKSFTYEFVAGPAGVYPYHCHVEPIVDHLNRGLYGMMIIDPPAPRAPANELVMVMNSYDLDLNEGMAPTFRPPTAAEANAIMNPPLPEEESDDETATEGASGPELEKERDNEFYTVNGRAFEYMDHPIQLKVGEPARIYLVNMIEFDPVNSFHLHSGMFKYIPAGTVNSSSYVTDVVILGQGDRGILEFTPQHTGMMMIHAHINEFSSLGWMGTFNVTA